MLRRNRQLKLQVYPNFGIVIAMVAVAFLEKGKIAGVEESPEPRCGIGVAMQIAASSRDANPIEITATIYCRAVRENCCAYLADDIALQHGECGPNT